MLKNTYLPNLKLMGRSTANKYIFKDDLMTTFSGSDRQRLPGAEEDCRIYGPAEKSPHVLHLAFTKPTGDGPYRILDIAAVRNILASILDCCGFLHHLTGRGQYALKRSLGSLRIKIYQKSCCLMYQ